MLASAGETMLLALLFLLRVFCFSEPLAANPAPHPPRFPVSAAALEREAVKLNGPWSFVSQDLREVLAVPGSWTYQGLPAVGIGLYESLIAFDRDIDSIALQSEFLATSYRVFADGRLVYSHGHGQSQMLHYPEFIPIPVQGREIRLGIEIQNEQDFAAGLLRPVVLGSPAALILHHSQKKLLVLPILFIALILCLYFAMGGRALSPDRSSWDLSGLCFSTTLFYTLQLFLLNHVSIDWGLYIRLFFSSCILFCYFLERCINGVWESGPRRVFRDLRDLIPLLSLLLLWIMPASYARFAFPVSVLHLLVFGMLSRWRRGRDEAQRPGQKLLIVLMITLLLTAAAHDYLCYFGLNDGTFIMGYMLLPYLGKRAYVLESRHSKLEVRRARLDAQSAAVVLAQTLAVRPQIAQPHAPYFTYVSCFRPSEEVGGDWIYLNEREGCLYFFLADVTGHGFASAVMTIAMSSAVLSVLDQCDPAMAPALRLELCANVANKAAFRIGQRLEKYATLSLNCLDLKSGRVDYIQAGHMPTLLAEGGNLIVLQNGHGILGVDPNAGFSSRHRMMKSQGKLFVYSDGLSENLGHDTIPIKARTLRRILLESPDPGAIQQRLKPFIREQQDDDVTYVAIQWLAPVSGGSHV